MKRRGFLFGAVALIAASGSGFGAGGARAQGGPQPEVATTPKALPTMTVDAVMLPPPVTPENTLYLDLSTGGRVSIQMRPDIAPRHIERIKTLTREKFYDGTVFHRVIEGFMAQGGDPTGTGQGASKLPDLKAEFNDLPHVRGAVAMARSTSPDSANSQFYIVLQPALKLDRTYTVWGRVIAGMEFVDAIERGEPPANPTKILQASIGSDNKPPPAPSTPIPGAVPPPPPAAGPQPFSLQPSAPAQPPMAPPQ